MKTTFYFFFILFSAMSAFSQELPFKYEWVNTDFNGVAFNDKAVVAYGDHGIITYSADRGETWGQTNIGAKHSIKKIIVYNNILYGVSEYGLFKSEDGINWSVIAEDEADNFCYLSNKDSILYVLKKDGIYSWNTNDNFTLDKIANLEEGYLYKEIVNDEDNIYISKEYYEILIFNISSNKFSSYKILDAKPTKKLYLNAVTNNIYFITEDIVNFDIYKSINKEINFNILGHLKSKAFLEKDTSLYVLYAESEVDTSDNLTNFLMNPVWYQIDNLNQPKKITGDKYPGRHITSYKISSFTHITLIGNDTLIAVGPKKLIAVSYDFGNTWNIKSYFSKVEYDVYGSTSAMGSFIDDKIFYAPNFDKYDIFKTSNSGATWLPQKYISKYNFEYYNAKFNILTRNIVNYHFNNKGEGFLRFKTTSQGDTNIAITRDYGETYLYAKAEDFPPRDANVLNVEAIEMKDAYLYAYSYLDSLNSVRKNQIARYDKEHNFIDVHETPAKFDYLMKINDSELIAMSFNYEGNPSDSTGKFEDYSYKYVLWESKDQGKTWDSLQIMIPFYPRTTKMENFIT